MLSLNLPQILIGPTPAPRVAAGVQKGGLPCPKGRPQIGGTMPKSHPRRNAAKRQNRRFRQQFSAKHPAFGRISAVILEVAEGAAFQRNFPAMRVQE
jgi:hypothetical protein